MKAIIIAAVFAVAVAAQEQGSVETPILYAGTTQGSAAGLEEGVINANGNAFWIGKPTTTACQKDADPLSAICDSNTKNKNTTIFSFVKGEKKLSLSVNIKGGQAVYVDPEDGHLAFTKGGDFGEYPDGAVSEGFARLRETRLMFENKDWVACPDATGAEEVYQVYALSRNGKTGCSGFSFILSEQKAPSDGGPSTAYVYV